MLFKMFMPLFRNKITCEIFGVEKKTKQLFSKIDVLMNKVSNRIQTSHLMKIISTSFQTRLLTPK